MRRIAALIGMALACVLAGLLAAGLLARSAPASSLDETVTESEPTPPPAPGVIADGVTIGGVIVWGLTADQATAAVKEVVRSPLDLWYGDKETLLNPEALKVRASIPAAVSQALSAEPGTPVPLRVRFDAARVRSHVAAIARAYDRQPVEAKVALRNGKPIIITGKVGRALTLKGASAAVAKALRENERGEVDLPFRSLTHNVGAPSFGPVIVIRRGANTLRLFRPVPAGRCGADRPRCATQLWKFFRVATGQSAYPTPIGNFGIVAMWKNPWWYPPDSDWAKGEEPVPPGPGNPLGTRWMGISSPGVGIHGTPDAASIGYSASHGCIRMKIPEAEWLFDHVRVGTPVFILP